MKIHQTTHIKLQCFSIYFSPLPIIFKIMCRSILVLPIKFSSVSTNFSHVQIKFNLVWINFNSVPTKNSYVDKLYFYW